MTGLTQCFEAQAGIIGRGQALCFVTEDQLGRLLRKSWQVVFPGVYAAFRGSLNADQRLWAARVYCGDEMLLTDRHVLLAHEVRYVPDEDGVHVLLPWSQTRKPRGLAAGDSHPTHPRIVVAWTLSRRTVRQSAHRLRIA